MNLIPVLDLKNGFAVHAQGGRRDTYLPVDGKYGKGDDPSALAASIARSFPCAALYIADLDAIEGKGSNASLIAEIKKATTLAIILDCGLRTAGEVTKSDRSDETDRLIVASETIASQDEIVRTVERIGPKTTIASLDFRNGSLLKTPTLNLDAFGLVETFIACGVGLFIILDLDRVGTTRGTKIDPALKRFILEHECRYYLGGGIGSTLDILTAEKEGASGVLLATALHNGLI